MNPTHKEKILFFFYICTRRPSNWLQNVMILPGNCVEFSLETSSLYAQDPHINRYGFKCLVVGYDNPVLVYFCEIFKAVST